MSLVYDAATDSWSELSPMPAGKERGSAIMGVHGEMIYVAGGMKRLSAMGQDGVSDVLSFNTTSAAWQDVPEAAADLLGARQHALGAVVEDTFYVVCGRWHGQREVKGEVFMLNLNDVNAGWKTGASNMPTARGGLFGAVVRGSLHAFGGEGNPDSDLGVFDQSEKLGLKSQQWTELGPMALPLHGTSAVTVGNRIYVGGGGVQEDGLPVLRDGIEHFLDTTDHFDAFVV